MTVLAVSRDRPVDPGIIAAIADVVSAARGADIDHFLGGALARDLILFHVYGQPTVRITRDVDLSGAVVRQILPGLGLTTQTPSDDRFWRPSPTGRRSRNGENRATAVLVLAGAPEGGTDGAIGMTGSSEC